MRLGLIGGLMLALGAIATSTAAATEPAITVAPDPAAKEAGLRFARALYSEQAQVDMTMRLVDTQISPMFRKNEDFIALEGEYPGFTDAVLKQFKIVLVQYTRESLPDYYDRIATVIASHLNAEEIDDFAAFYRTPTGQKLLRGISENVTANAMLSEVAADPDKPTTLSAVTSDHKAAAEAAAKLVDESDAAALIALTQKPYFLRAKAMIPEMRKLEQDFVNEPAPDFEKEVAGVVEDTLARLKAEKEGKR